MLPALALLATTAAAADAAPEAIAAAAAAKYPYRLEIAGEGRSLHLLDLDGKVVPTPDALLLVGLPEAAETYRQAERTRKNVASGLWIGAGVLGAGTVLLAPMLVDPTDGDSALRAAAATDALQYVVPVALGAGFVVRYVNPKRHLGAWADEETVRRAVDAHAEGVGGAAVLDRVAVYESRQLFIDYDGRVVDAQRRPIRMKELVERIDDPDVEDEYRRTRRIDKIAWGTTLGAGSGLTALGGMVALVGLISWSFNGDPTLLELGGGTLVVGLGGVGAGITGLAVSKAVHENPGRWYDEPTLRAELDAYDRTLREELQIPGARHWQLEVRPLVGPGVVGLTGTF